MFKLETLIPWPVTNVVKNNEMNCYESNTYFDLDTSDFFLNNKFLPSTISNEENAKLTWLELHELYISITRHLYEQDMLLMEAEETVKKFDSRLRELQRERIRVQVCIFLCYKEHRQIIK